MFSSSSSSFRTPEHPCVLLVFQAHPSDSHLDFSLFLLLHPTYILDSHLFNRYFIFTSLTIILIFNSLICKSWSLYQVLLLTSICLWDASTYEVKWSESHSVMSNSLWPHGLYSLWNSPGQNTGVGSLFLLQGIFSTQGSNQGLPPCWQILYQLSHKGSLRILEWVAYPFSSGSSWPRNRTGVSCIAGGFFINWPIYLWIPPTPGMTSLQLLFIISFLKTALCLCLTFPFQKNYNRIMTKRQRSLPLLKASMRLPWWSSS